jgi:hypothetical protein
MVNLNPRPGFLALGLTLLASVVGCDNRPQPESSQPNYDYFYTRDIPGKYHVITNKGEPIRIDYIERRIVGVQGGERRVVGTEYRYEDGSRVTNPDRLFDDEWGP